ncbi:unnamed protein product [Allacma fusca]|uniref:Uncharacterized protein n=1 Tax=Allacma fusca TaxID=39272 RepID=A0A8J2KCM1_9HEXA|nr:unnamed protein product [Allacma fusca]
MTVYTDLANVFRDGKITSQETNITFLEFSASPWCRREINPVDKLRMNEHKLKTEDRQLFKDFGITFLFTELLGL